MIKPTCEECGRELTAEEIEVPDDRGYGPICYTCETENHGWICGVCENWEDEDYEVTHFVVLNAEDAGAETGVYRILKRPFYRQPILGGGAHLYPDCVERVADLPTKWEEPDAYPPCAMLCQTCATPYIEEKPDGADRKEK